MQPEPFFKIRRDPRINWICKPVHKHREARGLTATGKKVNCFDFGFKILLKYLLLTIIRVADWARVAGIIIHQNLRPGGSIIHFRFVAIVKYLFFMFTTPRHIHHKRFIKSLLFCKLIIYSWTFQFISIRVKWEIGVGNHVGMHTRGADGVQTRFRLFDLTKST